MKNTLDFSSQKSKKKIGNFFLGLFTWNHPHLFSQHITHKYGTPYYGSFKGTVPQNIFLLKSGRIGCIDL